jgi:hypothetical protein
MTTARRLVCLGLAFWWAWLPLVGTPAADRGIGGTGGPAAGPEISDRGIGGTGIAGVITGFGSVIVNGLEIASAPTTPLTVDGEPDSQSALRVGQYAAVVASGDNGLQAVSIAVRHEVSGPVTSVTPGSSSGSQTVVVAGQRVAIASTTEGLQAVHPGDWIAVSGLRGPDGVIAASRIDQRTPGTVLVSGPATASAGGWRIGDLPVQPPAGTNVTAGESITAQGTIVDGRLSATAASPDVLASNPGAYFGTHVQRMVIEGYASAAGGRVRFGRGFVATAGPGVAAVGTHRAIIELRRGPNGGFVATHFRGVYRPVGPGRHGALVPPRGAPHPFGPREYGERYWENRRWGYDHAGGWEPRGGCPPGGGCRRHYGPP